MNVLRFKPYSFSRSITYLHTGGRIRGLKRDPADFLTNPKGLLYTSLTQSTYQDKIRSILNLQKYDIKLSNDLILQSFTFKSFAHGQKPYNEKLSILGYQFLKFYTSIYSIQNTSNNNNDFVGFNSLGKNASKALCGKNTISQFIQSKNLHNFIFWKMRNPLLSLKYNGADIVFNSVLNAILGSILLSNGQKKAIDFINGELLNNNNDISLISIINQSRISQNNNETTMSQDN